MMRLVIALGGNALLRRGEPMDAETQRRNVAIAAASVAAVSREHRVIVTHGNGPQIGLLALQAEAYKGSRPYPLDVLGAESEGMIGYLIEQELRNQLPEAQIATLLTMVEVDPADPGFAHPTKPIGPVYSGAESKDLAALHGWTMTELSTGFRRVVASPQPRRIVGVQTARLLVDSSVLVICTGGGGIPVVKDSGGKLCGVEAVVDKDLAAAVLARELGADGLLLLTDVDAVYDAWATPQERPINRASSAQLRTYTFEPGSMGPKVEAACRFVEAGGAFAAIGHIRDAAAIALGKAGTYVSAAA